MKVLLIVRDKRRGGTSIEGIFRTLEASGDHSVSFSTWYYDDTKSKLSNMRDLRRIRADLYHITGDIYYVALFLLGRKIMLTIHDIGAYKRFTGFKKWVYGKVWIVWPVRMASMVITVSDFTRRDVENVVPRSGPKLKTIHNGYNPEFRFDPKTKPGTPARLLLIGTAVHKNVETVIRMAAGTPYTLVIIGKLNDQQVALLHHTGVKYENYYGINTAELYEQYKLADILVFISLHEGFGMPVIEAQAIGRPVITTSIASIPEVGGDGVYYMKDPFDTGELASIIEKILSDNDFRMELVQKGCRNAGRFSLDAMVNQYKAVYHQLVDRRSK